MNKEFIPYEEALALKKLGFDEPCYGLWLLNLIDNKKPEFYKIDIDSDENSNKLLLNKACLAPLYQQAFRWFRDKHEIFVAPFKISYGSDPYLWSFEINDCKFRLPLDDDAYDVADFDTYEEAELACLRKLIEIVKNNK